MTALLEVTALLESLTALLEYSDLLQFSLVALVASMLATPLQYPFQRVIQSHYNDTLLLSLRVVRMTPLSHKTDQNLYPHHCHSV